MTKPYQIYTKFAYYRCHQEKITKAMRSHQELHQILDICIFHFRSKPTVFAYKEATVVPDTTNQHPAVG